MRKRRHRNWGDLRYNNPDSVVLDQLRRLGDDLSTERLIHFYLYLPSGQNAEKAKDELLRMGYTVDCEKSQTASNWLCLATKKMLPRLADLISIRATLERLATRLEGEFDGWETQAYPNELEITG